MRNRLFLFLGILFTITNNSYSQGTWTFAAPTDGTGSTGPENARSICVDASGNTYIVGNFNGSGVATDFDLSSSSTNTYTATSTDGYIASYDKNGNFRWKTIISGTSADFSVPSGGVCTNGTYVWVSGSANVSVGAASIISSTNTVVINSPGAGLDVFVGKLNCSNGAVQWAQGFGGTGGNDYGEGICVDPNGYCYLVGAYSGAFTLGSINAPAPGGASDFFIAKFNPSGTMIRFNSGGSTTTNDNIGNGGGICYVPGTTPALVSVGQSSASTATFGAFTGLGNYGLNDAFLVELDTTLNFTNALVMGSTAADELTGCAYDPLSGGVFVSGFCSGNITYPGTAALTGLGANDIIVARYNVSTNNFVWSSLFGGTTNERAWGVAADGYGGILVSGYSQSAPCNFNNSLSIPTNSGANDLFVARFNAAGTTQWLLTAAGTGSEDARSLASYVETSPSHTQTIFVTGLTTAAGCNFGSTFVGNDGGSDFFLAKINDASAPTFPLSATQSQVNLTCNGVCNGSATVVASGGTSPYTYSWSPSGGSGATASSLCAGSYTCTITDATSATITKNFTITQPTAISLTALAQTNVSCNGGSNGAASVNAATGGAGGYTYNWTPGNPTGDGTTSVTGLTAQAYTCTVTDANSCTAQRNFTITQPTTISLTALAQTNVSCNGGSNGAASVNIATGGAGGYTYNWTPGNPTGDGTTSVTGLTQGTWTCTVTDVNSCTAQRNFTITQPTAISLTAQSQTNVSCNGGSNGAASVNVATGGAGGYTYNWTPGNPTGDGTTSVTGLTAQSYTCTVTDANGCTAAVNITITQPTSISLTAASQTNVSCNGGSNGAASVNIATGGAGGYTYNWTPGNPTGDGTTSVTGLTQGTWTCTVTDANSCTAQTSFTITQPTIITASISSTTTACASNTGTATVSSVSGGAGGYTYNWTPGNPTGDGTVSISGLGAGTYTCTITDVNGCSIAPSVSVSTVSGPSLTSSSQTNVSCNGGSNGAASVNVATGGAGGYTYNWTPGNPTGDGTTSVTGLTAQAYTCTVTDANGCTAAVNFTITQPSALSLTAASQTNVSCNGGSNGAASVNVATGGAGGYTYNWTPGNPTGDGTTSVTGLTAQAYTCTVTDANGCTAAVNFTITQPTALSMTSASQTNVSCNGGSNGAASVNVATGGAGGYTYNWTPGNPTGDGTTSVTGLTAQAYTCTVTDANGCTAAVNLTITQPTAISLTALSQINVSCNGGSNGAASVNVATGGAGGYTYNWTPGNPTGDGTTSVTGLTAQAYTCTVTDANGCTAAVNLTITQPSALSLTAASQTNVSCNGGSNGAASVNIATGGAGGYTYNWTPGNPTGDGTTSVSGLTAQAYTCTVTDANGCTAAVNVTITQPTAISLTAASQTNVSCNGGSNGAASVNVATGGAGGYTYNWTPGNPTGDGTTSVTGLTAQAYTCTVTDANGCTAAVNFTITQPSALSLTAASQTNVSCNGGSNGAASVNVATGGAGGYTYNWTPGNPTGDGTTSVTGLTAQAYTCTVTDANGCTAAVNVTITQPTAISLTAASQTNVSCNGGSNGAASVNVATGGAGGYTYNWTPGNPTGDGTTSVTGLTAQVYTCTVTDANGCTAAVNFIVTEPTTLVASSSASLISCNGGTSNVTVTATGGTAPYTGEGTFTETVGSYSYTVTDANGCAAITSITISEPTALVAGSSATNISCNGGTADVTVTVTGGTSPYTGEGTFTETAGSYSYTVTDANGCTAITSITISEPTALIASSSATTISCNGGTADVTVTATGGTAPYTGEGTFTEIAGSYSYTVTDANGCAAITSITISEPTALVASSSSTTILCNGGTADITVTATGGTAPYIGEGTFTESAGSYSYTITDANGCSSSTNITITEPTTLVASSNATTISCNGGTADVTVTAAGGTALYTGVGTFTEVAGSYSYTVTDANGCTATTNISITEPTALIASSNATTISCNGATADVTVTATGGTSPYTGEGTFTELAGSYSYTVTDANGCSATTNISIAEPTALVASSSATTILCNGGTSDVIVTATGGTAPYTGEGTFIESAGSYSYTITDVNGCTATELVSISEPSAISITIDGTTSPSVCTAADGTASISVSGGTMASTYSYSWSDGGNYSSILEDPADLAAGNYTVTVTDDNGCTSSESISISDPNGPQLTLNSSSDTTLNCHGDADGNLNIDVTLSGGATSATFDWNNGFSSNEDIAGLDGGVYTIEVTDNNGCVTSATYNITDPDTIIVSANITNVSCFDMSDGAIDITATGGTIGSDYTYDWNSGQFSTQDIMGLGAGNYSLNLTDDNGCAVMIAYNVSQPGPINTNTSLSGTTITSLNTQPSATYQWIDCNNGNLPISGETTQNYNAIVDGDYAVIVTIGACSDTSACVNINTSGIGENTDWNGLSIYPNPTNSLVKISYHGGINSLVLFNAIGQSIQSLQVNGSVTEIDLSHLERGVYFVKITSNENEILKKIVKN